MDRRTQLSQGDLWRGIRSGSIDRGYPEDPPAHNTKSRDEVNQTLRGAELGFFSLAARLQNVVKYLDLPARRVPTELLDRFFVEEI